MHSVAIWLFLRLLHLQLEVELDHPQLRRIHLQLHSDHRHPPILQVVLSSTKCLFTKLLRFLLGINRQQS